MESNGASAGYLVEWLGASLLDTLVRLQKIQSYWTNCWWITRNRKTLLARTGCQSS